MGRSSELHNTKNYNKRIVEFLAPGKDSYPKVTIKDALEKFEEGVIYPNIQEKNRSRTSINVLRKFIKLNIPLSEFKFHQLWAALKKTGHPEHYARQIGSSWFKFIEWFLTGNYRYVERGSRGSYSGPGKEISLKFSEHKIEDIKNILPCNPGSDRFSALRMVLMRIINETPENEFRTVDAEGIEGRELKRLTENIEGFMIKNAPDWSSIWNPADNIFVVARKKHLSYLQGGKQQ